jgi:hypothetical protein
VISSVAIAVFMMLPDVIEQWTKEQSRNDRSLDGLDD